MALADDADRISLAHFGEPVPAVAKPDGTPVTEADQAIEAALRERIVGTYPDHHVVGEETGGELGTAAPTWVLDPIDGTKNFMRGIPIFATLIGVVVAGDPVVGVVSAPAMEERWDAASGHGARRNGRPIGVSAIGDLGKAHVLHGGLEWYRRRPGSWEALGRLAEQAWRTRGFGDYWMHLLVAGGMAEVAFEHDLSPWDIAAVAAVVTEAGGRMTTWDGLPPLSGHGDVLSTNGLLHDRLVELLSTG